MSVSCSFPHSSSLYILYWLYFCMIFFFFFFAWFKMEKNPNTTNHSESKENHWAIWLLQSLVSAISYILQTAEVHISCQDIPVIVDKVLSLKSFSEALWTWLLWKKKRIISHSASLLGSAVPPAAPALLWLGHSSFTSILWFPIIAFPQLQTIHNWYISSPLLSHTMLSSLLFLLQIYH